MRADDWITDNCKTNDENPTYSLAGYEIDEKVHQPSAEFIVVSVYATGGNDYAENSW